VLWAALVSAWLLSLTPALSRWERGPVAAVSNCCGAFGEHERGLRFSLSQRERAGVRENASFRRRSLKLTARAAR